MAASGATQLSIEIDGGNLVACVRAEGSDRSRCMALPLERARVAIAYAQEVLSQADAKSEAQPKPNDASDAKLLTHVEMRCENGVFHARWPDLNDATSEHSMQLPASEVENIIETAREAIRRDRKEQN
ncbi:hypothetical protein Q3G72_025765 [Acer saccharum]|nr:hypothetical protein Q3G72_025765 [Acer saccharum]